MKETVVGERVGVAVKDEVREEASGGRRERENVRQEERWTFRPVRAIKRLASRREAERERLTWDEGGWEGPASQSGGGRRRRYMFEKRPTKLQLCLPLQT